MFWRYPLRHENFTAPFSRRLLPRDPQSAFAMGCVRSGNLDDQLVSVDLNARNITLDDSAVIHWLQQCEAVPN